VDVETVTAALDDITAALRADGADLLVKEADPRTARVRLELDLTNVTCLECVLPPDMLETMIEHALRPAVGGEFELIVDDTRRASAGP